MEKEEEGKEKRETFLCCLPRLTPGGRCHGAVAFSGGTALQNGRRTLNRNTNYLINPRKKKKADQEER